ncbi:MAG: Smr/MutS family protein [Flavobacteriales bacterium]|nr:Smr/MutS family protein [Flavobacteriales bacterium]
MSRVLLDLHDVFNNSKKIEASLSDAFFHAIDCKIKTIEIIHGKGSGQLKKRVIRFLESPEIKSKYHRIEKDSKNFGRTFVHFKF